MGRKVAFYTLGCKLNFSETSTISRMFEDAGYRKVNFNDTPDVYVINTCSVTDNADKKCRKIVKEAKSISPGAYVAVIGCYAQLKPKEISEIKGVNAVLGAAEKFKLVENLQNHHSSKTLVKSTPIAEANEYHSSFSIGDRTRSFLKIQDGCNYGCAFCTIPLARGKSRSSSIENVVRQAREIAIKGVKEIVLTGVNIGDFGIQNGSRRERFSHLIEELDKVAGIERFRISSIEPNLLSPEIIGFVARSNKFLPHFHIPLQSGSDTVLRHMGRRYLAHLYEDRIAMIKALMPHSSIGADVIVGFPGETDKEFLKTHEFLNRLEISYLHVFTYSERPNTKSIQMSKSVPQPLRNERSKMLRILSDKKRSFFYRQHLGKTYKVLFESQEKDGYVYGYTDNYIKVKTLKNQELFNTIMEVTLSDIDHKGIMNISLPETSLA